MIAQRLGILSMADSILVLENGKLDAFGERRDVAAKIYTGRTSLPARNKRIIAALCGDGETAPAEPIIAQRPTLATVRSLTVEKSMPRVLS